MGNPFIVAEDLALKTHLAGLTVSDEKSAARQVKIWFGYPDVEVRAQEFPFITIDLIDIVPTTERQNSGVMYDSDYNGTIAPSAGVSYKYDIPVAYDLVYQVTSYARHPRHDRAIMYQLLNKFPSKFGKLAVPNQLGTETGYRSMFLDGFVKRDAVESETGNRRLLRNALSVRVVSEMSPLLVDAVLGRQVEEVFLDTRTPPLTGYQSV
jgi:adenylylsulfate kinase-like enzyme